MKYYVSDKTIQDIKKGFPMCDVYMPTKKTNTRNRAIDIAILSSCHSCNQEFVLEDRNDLKNGDFCDNCLTANVA